MGNVVVEMSGDEAKLFRSFEKIIGEKSRKGQSPVDPYSVGEE